MSETYVERTCTHLGGGIAEIGYRSDVPPVESRPISEFRDERAYVLLGDAGLGKTTEFRNECARLGTRAAYLSARNLVTLEIRPEWRDKTLFVDGLDEIRAGSADGRSALDQIRNRLDQLGWPYYRISCREADWLGSNDRRSLESATPGGKVAVLRLDPLDYGAKHALVAARLDVDDTSAFFDGTEQRGLDTMLENPLTLELLTGAFTQRGGSWPASRRETFELACERMAREHNDEHIAAAGVTASVEGVLTAAGGLCALQLLAGVEGYSLGPEHDGSSYVPLDTLQPLSAGLSSAESRLRRHALGTKLFSAAHESDPVASQPRVTPSHRHIAEFLGGRYLARLVEDGLLARRAIALMTSPLDGRVATSLRGLSAWFAAHCVEALDQLIDADPVGIGLYGDVGRLSGEQRRRLLKALAAYAAQGPLLGHEWRDERSAGYLETTAWAFRSIVDAGTVDAIADLLRGDAEDPASDRIADFLLRVLVEAGATTLDAAKPLALIALAIAREPSWSPPTRRSALDAFLHLERDRQARDDALAALLTDIAERRLSDPEDDLAGLALRELYPHRVAPADVWSFLGLRNRENYHGAFGSFWSDALIGQSSAADAADALDALWSVMSHQGLRGGIDEVLRRQGLDLMPVELLKKALDGLGDQADVTRLFGWLTAAATCGRDIHPAARKGLHDAIAKAEQDVGPHAMQQLVGTGTDDGWAIDEFVDPAGSVREWLEQRPHKQRQLYLEWLKALHDDVLPGHQALIVPIPLFFSVLPRDLGRWCLEQALALEASEPDRARDVLRHVVRQQLNDSAVNEGLTLDTVAEATKSSPLLSNEFDHLLAAVSLDPKRAAREAEILDIHRENERKEHELRQQWTDHVRNNSQALRDGTFPVNNLDSLARIYFGHRSGSDRDVSGQERLTEFLEGDSQDAAAVTDALAVIVLNAELPTVDETISLLAQSKHAWVAWPLFAGLQLVEDDEPERLHRLEDERKRRVLATYFCVVHSLDRAPPWLQSWIADDPDLVADVFVRCVIGEVRTGGDSSFALNGLADLGFDERAMHQIRLRILRSFPTAAPQRQLGILDSLLFDVITGSETDGVRNVIEAKLAAKSLTVAQRARWLATAAILFEGPYVDQLADFAANHTSGVRRLAEFLCHKLGPQWAGEPNLVTNLEPATLAAFIEALGSTFPPIAPTSSAYSVTVGIRATEWIESFLTSLTRLASAEATDALRRLVQMPEMSAWRDILRRSAEAQSVVRRDAEYRPPTVDEVQRTLGRGAPANAADLAALLLDRLDDLSDEMRGAASDPWRPYWNEDGYGRPDPPKPENSCRDSLLTTLKQRLPPEIDVEREGSYAAGRRADIRVSGGGFNVPIEIKRQSHRDLWNAMRTQLIGQYTMDPATDGYGIYLVLWFGDDNMPTPKSGRRPNGPDELREMLEASLSLDEARKISVRVIDVTKPEGGGGPSIGQPRSWRLEGVS